MKCPRCGTDNRTMVRFCRHCGQQLVTDQTQDQPAELTEQPATQKNAVCGFCEAAVKPTARFCPRCGKELNKPAQNSVLPQSVLPSVVQSPGVTTGNMQPPPSSFEVPKSTTRHPPLHQPSYSQPLELPPPSSLNDAAPKPKGTFTGDKQKKGGIKKSTPSWLWGAILGIFLLIAILIVLGTVYIPKALKGTGLLTTDTPTAVVSAQPSPTATPDHSPSATPEPTYTPEATVELPMSVIPAAIINLLTTPETVTVSNQVIVTVTLTNNSELQISPLRCDLIGEFAPSLEPAAGIPYTMNYPDTEPPLNPGETYFFVYVMDAVEPGKVILGASILIEVNSPKHRQALQTQLVTLTIQ